eukprot:gene16897-20093_t
MQSNATSHEHGWRQWSSDSLLRNQRFHNLVYYRMGNLKFLAETLAEPEPWGKELKILKIYIDNTFKRLVEENKLLAYFPEHEPDTPMLVVFNIGLLSRTYEELFCVLQSIASASIRDREQESGGRRCEERQWILKEFITTPSLSDPTKFEKYGADIEPLSCIPERAYYFSEGVGVACFDPAIPIDIDADFSMIISNANLSKIDRLPLEYARFPEKDLNTRFQQGIRTTINRVHCNPRLAVPQYHRDADGSRRIDLLLPISMSGRKDPDCSLVIRYATDEVTGDGYYQVRGILSKEDSYINARVIQKIDQKWMDYSELEAGATPLAAATPTASPSQTPTASPRGAPPPPEQQHKKLSPRAKVKKLYHSMEHLEAPTVTPVHSTQLNHR